MRAFSECIDASVYFPASHRTHEAVSSRTGDQLCSIRAADYPDICCAVQGKGTKLSDIPNGMSPCFPSSASRSMSSAQLVNVLP